MSASSVPQDARRIGESTWVVESHTNSGWLDGLLIDTCPFEETYAGVDITQLVITHGHADHFSSAAALRRESDFEVFASREDASLIENPDINVRGMFSWAKPSDEFITRLFRGEGCAVDGYLDQWSHPRVLAVPLAGHTLGHTGYLTDDGILFSGDALYLEELWARHPLPYAIDADLVAASLETIRNLEFDWLVPGHGRAVERAEVGRHIDFHIAQIRAIEEFIVDRLREARTTEEIIADVSRERDIVENPAQYWLAVTTVKGFLGGLLERGRIEFVVREHVGCWQAV